MTTRSGPVTITGSTGQVGRALQQRLADLPNKVRTPDRHAPLAPAVRDAEVVIHLAGTLRPRRGDDYRAANLGTVEATAGAVAGSTVRRLVFLSFLTADIESTNPYLRHKARAEEVLRTTGIPTVVLRSGHVYGPPSAPGPTAAAFLADDGRVSVLGDGSQRLTPVFLGDVVEAIARAALDPDTPTGTFELAGPDTLTVDELVVALNGDAVRLRHLPVWLARGLAWFLPSLPGPLVDVMLSDAVADGDPTATADRFGVTLHHVSEVWP